MSIEEDKLAWNKIHRERAMAFLQELRQLEAKHKCYVWVDESCYVVKYEDFTCPDSYIQICPTIVDEIYKKGA